MKIQISVTEEISVQKIKQVGTACYSSVQQHPEFLNISSLVWEVWFQVQNNPCIVTFELSESEGAAAVHCVRQHRLYGGGINTRV
jgi:hypothetical protein